MLVTQSELMYIRRLRKGKTQAEEAAARSLSRYAYRLLEDPEDDCLVLNRKVSRYENLLLMRRRSGWTIAEIAEEFGCSPFWYRELEKQAHPDVEEFLCSLMLT